MPGLGVAGSTPITNGPTCTGAGRDERLATTELWMRASMFKVRPLTQERRAGQRYVGPPSRTAQAAARPTWITGVIPSCAVPAPIAREAPRSWQTDRKSVV